jgi:hypothetical protein
MKYELKIEIKDTNLLTDLIKSAYLDGKLNNKELFLSYNEETNIYNLCKGLSNLIARIYNNDIIEGSARFIILEKDNMVKLYPCSIYCDYENKKYIFSA